MKGSLRDRLAAAQTDLARRLEDQPPVELLIASRFGFDFLDRDERCEQLERFPADRVGGLQRTPGPGHGHLLLCSIDGRRALVHEWEKVPGEVVHPAEEAFMVWTAARLEIPIVLHVCAGQALEVDVATPSVQVIGNHIAWDSADPLAGWSSPREGARFPQLEDPYDVELCRRTSQRLGGPPQGRVAFVRQGPSGPTRAERECYRRLGGEVLVEAGASEAVAARHCLRRFAALALVLDAHGEEPLPDPGILAARADQTLPDLFEAVRTLVSNLDPSP